MFKFLVYIFYAVQTVIQVIRTRHILATITKLYFIGPAIFRYSHSLPVIYSFSFCLTSSTLLATNANPPLLFIVSRKSCCLKDTTPFLVLTSIHNIRPSGNIPIISDIPAKPARKYLHLPLLSIGNAPALFLQANILLYDKYSSIALIIDCSVTFNRI